jgi:hypothetical protein
MIMSDEGEDGRKTALITLETTEAEIVALDSDGRTLEFDESAFKRLPDAVVQALSHENAKRYWVTLGAVDRNARPKPTRKLEILDPLQGQEEKLMEIRALGPKGKEYFKRWHTYWAYLEKIDVAKAMGYTEITKDEAAANELGIGVSSDAAGYYTIRSAGTFNSATAGKEELRLMKLPLEKYRAHMQGVAARSEDAVNKAREKVPEAMDQARIPQKYWKQVNTADNSLTEDELEPEAARLTPDAIKGTAASAEVPKRGR